MINEVKEICNHLIRKSRYSGRLSASEYNRLAKMVQLEIIRDNIKTDGLERVTHIADELIDLKVSSTVAISGTKFPKPADFMYLSTLEYADLVTSTFVPIDILRGNEFGLRSRSNVVDPTTEFPIGRYVDGGWEVLPSSIDSLIVWYIKQPADPIWDYTTSSGREVYDAGGSTDFEIPEVFLTELVMGILEKIGISVRENQVIQVANGLKDNG